MVRYHTLLALRELGRRGQFLDGQLERLDELIVPLVTARAPALLRLYGIGPDTAAMLLIAAGDNPARLRSEAAWAHLCAAAPIPASSGKTQNRHRLNRGGDRQANHALWRIVITRMSSHPATRAYASRRTAEGLRQWYRRRPADHTAATACAHLARARSWPDPPQPSPAPAPGAATAPALTPAGPRQRPTTRARPARDRP